MKARKHRPTMVQRLAKPSCFTLANTCGDTIFLEATQAHAATVLWVRLVLSRVDRRVADAFSEPSPDDKVLAAQSKGSLSARK